mmetsp:Transcript_4464/g.4927  ORF Transcript_4464/g.4927 Transcript_4464/m.4927 type:complete len:81 (-) Transcript_4464:575-817(-)
MKIQNLGIASDDTKTPQNNKDIMNNMLARFAALSANSLNDTHNWAIVEAKMKNNTISIHINAPLSATLSVGSAFLYKPTG